MDPTIRNTTGLIARIEKDRDDLIKRFESIINLAGIDNADRNTTAIVQFQMQVETTALIRAAEELQTLIRQMQEAWLFGQLNTVGENKLEKETDEKAKEIASLLKKLTEKEPAVTNGSQVETTST